jgi:hypothetical protein
MIRRFFMNKIIFIALFLSPSLQAMGKMPMHVFEKSRKQM